MHTFLAFMPLILVSIFALFAGVLIISSDNEKARKKAQKAKQKQKKIILVS